MRKPDKIKDDMRKYIDKLEQATNREERVAARKQINRLNTELDKAKRNNR